MPDHVRSAGHSCHSDAVGTAASHANHRHGHGGHASLATSFHATVHCLTGCVIGEVAGLMLGVSLGLQPFATIALATALSYLSGMALGLIPVMRRQRIGMLAALKIIWIGEVVSIGAMELAMNWVDYRMGGMMAPSIASWMFWRGIVFAIPAGFVAAWPVNYWLLNRNLKACH
jgi:hypothetical protein